LRREALAQELAEAEAGDQIADLGLGMEVEGGERDLDEEVPEADVTALDDDNDDDDDDDDDEDEDDEEPSEEYTVPRGVLAARVPEDAYREALMRGSALDGALNDEDDGAGDMLQESDLIQTQASTLHMGSQLDMDMEVDLDAEVPEADEYEHTDTEEELSSSEEGSSPGFGPRSGQGQTASSMVRSDGTQNSMDLSSPQRFSDRRSGY